MKVTNLVYAMVKLNYLKGGGGGGGRWRGRNIHSGPFLRSWVEKSPVESAVMVDLIVLKMSSKEKAIQSFLKMNVNLKCARSWNDWKKSEVEMFI